MVQLFFNKLEVHKNSQNCRLAQSVNYICGCEGIGYAGANTSTKQVVLAWLPRVSGILSAMVSIDGFVCNTSICALTMFVRGHCLSFMIQ